MPHVLHLSNLISEGELAGKRVLIYAGLNVSRDNAGNITEDMHIHTSVPAVKAVLDAGAAVVVISHLGHPIEGEFKPGDSLAPVARRLSELLGRDVKLIQNQVDDMDVAPGQVVLLGNCRVNKGEKKSSDELAQKAAKLCDIYVNDAFDTAHRAEATTYGIAKLASITYASPLLTTGLDALGKALDQPARPLMAAVTGLKVSTKLTILKSLADRVDSLIVGGGIANTFMLAAGLKIGKSLAEAGLVDDAKTIIEMLAARGASVLIPIDVVCAKEFSATATAIVEDMADVADDDMILDIGPEAAARLAKQLKSTDTIVQSGPVGVFEFDQFDNGTKVLVEAIAAPSGLSITGGDDAPVVIAKYDITDKVGYISADGGVFLKFPEDKALPAVEILEQRVQSQAAMA